MTALSYRNLSVTIPGTQRPVLADLSLEIARGEIVGLVGESGSGKSTTARAALGLLPDGAEISGSVSIGERDVLSLNDKELRVMRSHDVGMVYQDPRNSINPVRTIGDFATEQLRTTRGVSAHEAKARLIALMGEVGLRDPERLFDLYPHQLSGGMLQRVVIAAALASDPEVLLADEATSALDVSTQASIVRLLLRLRRDRGIAILFITHDLGLAAAMCDRVAVMYAGRIVEVRPGDKLFSQPAHPYTAGLRDSTPELASGRRLRPITGAPPSLSDAPPGCEFAPRCPFAEAACTESRQALIPLADGGVACRRFNELDLAPDAASAPQPAETVTDAGDRS